MYKKKFLNLLLTALIFVIDAPTFFAQLTQPDPADRIYIKANTCKNGPYSERIDLRQDESYTFSEGFNNPTTEFRLHFKILQKPTNPDAELNVQIFLRSDNSLIWSFSAPKELNEFWSVELDPKGVRIVLSAKNKNSGQLLRNSGSRLVVDQIIKCDPGTLPQSVFLNKFESITSSTVGNEIKSVGRAIARLSIVSDSGLPMYCTGFLVSPDLIITNRHCVFSGTEAANLTASFDYDSFNSTLIKIGVKEIIAASCDLDFILLQLKNSACQSVGCTAPTDRKPISLKNSAIPPLNSTLLVIQHPEGSPKQISKQGCSMFQEKAVGNSSSLTDFGNRCDTASGSSGSPVFLLGTDGRVGSLVGIHHLGIRTEKVMMEIPENERMNRAVYAQQIFEYLRLVSPGILSKLN